MVRTRSRRLVSTLFVCAYLLVLATSSYAQAPSQAGVARVPLPKLPAPAKKDRSNLPPIPIFKDVAKEVGLTVSHIAAPEAHYVIDSTSGGVGLFDCDDDGRLDVVLVDGSTVERYRAGGDPLVTLYHQELDGTFKDITKEAGLTRRGWGMGVAVADYDNDGKLDLFVTGFGGSALYHGLGVMWVDYDDDGWPDLLVANDSVPNYLYHNNHNGTFTDMGMLTGVALSGEGTELGNMGVDWGDYDHSGRLSFFVTHFEEQPNSLYRNMGSQGFDDVSWTSAVGPPSYPYVGWGAAFFDMDNDTWLDILVANGHVYPHIHTLQTAPQFPNPLPLHRNNH